MKPSKISVTCPIDHGYVDGKAYLVVVRVGKQIVSIERFDSRKEQLLAAHYTKAGVATCS